MSANPELMPRDPDVEPAATSSSSGATSAAGDGSTLLRTGRYAWAAVGVLAVLVVAGLVAGRLSLVVVPLILALFPAALLEPLTRWLRRVMPAAAAALLTLLGSLALLAAIVALFVPLVAAELPTLRQSFRQGLNDLDGLLAGLPFAVPSPSQLIDRITAGTGGNGSLVDGAVRAATAVVETVAGTVFGLVALFFYLKDGGRIARGIGDLVPGRIRTDVAEVARRVWATIGSYFRGQLLIALVDAVLIGLGLLLLGVPLALPLTVLVFFGALFPIVGAFVSGTVAVVAALAHGGLTLALIVLALIVGVQQLEGNVLEPVVFGRATSLHPLMVLVAIAAGAVALGVLGAFLAVPLAASVARAVDYLRGGDEESGDSEPAEEPDTRRDAEAEPSAAV